MPWVAVALAAMLGAAGADAAAAEALVAVVGPADGADAARTRVIRAAAERGIARLAGSVGGEPVRIVADDDGCTAAGGEAAARRVAALRPALVLGHPCAASAIAAAKVYAQADILFIATATRHPALTQRRAGPTIFRLDGRDDRQGRFAGQEIARLYPGERVALLSDRTIYARRIVAEAQAALRAAGAPEPVLLPLVAGEKDYARLVAAVAASGARVVLFAGFAIEAGIVLRQLRAANSTARFIGSDATATAEFPEVAGDAGRGARCVVRAEADPGAALSVAADARAGDAHAPTADSAGEALARRTEVGVAAWAAAVARAGTLAGRPVAAALQAGGESGAQGAISFEAGGDARLESFRLIDVDRIAATR